MKKLTKKTLVTFLAMFLVLTLVPVHSMAAITAPKSATAYLLSSDGTSYSYLNLDITGLSSKQSVAKSSVKSSNKKVLAVDSITTNTYKSSYKEEYFNGQKARKSSSSGREVGITLQPKKAGKATVSYKVGSKKYKTAVTVKKYVNPVKSIKITGINKGKNLASLTNKNHYANVKVSGSSDTWINVTAKSGWKIENISVYSKNGSYNFYSSDSKKVSSVKLGVASLKKLKAQEINVRFMNTKDKGEIYLSYYLQ